MIHNVLLIEEDPGVAGVIQTALADASDSPFIVEWVRRLSDGLERVRRGGIAAALLDLFLPDSQGINTFSMLSLAAPGVPILVLVGLSDEDTAKEAVNRGAQDYLLKIRLDRYSLTRALHSVIARKAVEDALFLEKERAQVTLNSIGDAVISTDISGNITYLNQVAERMTGWSGAEASGRPFAEVFQIIEGVTREPAPNPMQLAVKQNQAVGLTSNCILVRRDGYESAIEDSTAPIHSRAGQVIGAVMVFRDVSEARAMRLKMTHLAQHDFLTDLPNRLLLNDRITQAISLARRHGKHLAVLFLDLDGFKHINDSLGHENGDKVLQLVAQRLVACVRTSDTISRHGGDEFVILLSEIAEAGDAAISAKKILVALARPHAISERNVHLSASIGISIYPQDGHDADTLIKSADTAMYLAKGKGSDKYHSFSQNMNVRGVERQFLESSLGRALERQEFLLHYQPKVDLNTGLIVKDDAEEGTVDFQAPVVINEAEGPELIHKMIDTRPGCAHHLRQIFLTKGPGGNRGFSFVVQSCHAHHENVKRGERAPSDGEAPCSGYVARLAEGDKHLITIWTLRLYLFAHFSLFLSNATIYHYRLTAIQLPNLKRYNSN